MGGSTPRQTPQQTSTQVTQLPGFVQPVAQNYLQRGQALSQTPFQSYQGIRVSPLNTVHNFALNQGRQQFIPSMTNAANQIGNFMAGAFNQPAYIHPFLGSILPSGISQPPFVGSGGKGGQQPPMQNPVQPGFPSGPPNPVTGAPGPITGPPAPVTGVPGPVTSVPINPMLPVFPDMPAPTPATAVSPVRRNLSSVIGDSGGSADEDFDGSLPIGTGYDMASFPDENTGSFAQYAPTLGRIGGALAPIPGGYFLGGMIGDSIADAYSDETLADVYDPGYNFGDTRGPSLGYAPSSLTPDADDAIESAIGQSTEATMIPAPGAVQNTPLPDPVEMLATRNLSPTENNTPTQAATTSNIPFDPETGLVYRSTYEPAPSMPVPTPTAPTPTPSLGPLFNIGITDRDLNDRFASGDLTFQEVISNAVSRGLIDKDKARMALDPREPIATLGPPQMMGIMDALPGVDYYGSNTNPGESFVDFSGFGGLGVDPEFFDPADPNIYDTYDPAGDLIGDDDFGFDATGGFEI